MAVTPPTNMRIPSELLRQIDDAAARAGQKRTAWVVDTLRAAVDNQGDFRTSGSAVADRAAGRARAAARQAVRTAPVVTEEVCVHPVGRRIGRLCAACGVSV